MKRNIILITLVCAIAGTGIIAYLSNKKDDNIPIYYNQASYVYDLSSPEKAIGATNYTFIGKVNSIKGVEYRDPVEIELNADGSKKKVITDPYTIYNVEVIENIKGNLVKEIELVEYGGYSKDMNAYIYFEGMSGFKENHYYIFMAFAVRQDGELQITSPDLYVDLGTNIDNLSKNKKYQEYITAFGNQIIPEGYNDLTSKYNK